MVLALNDPELVHHQPVVRGHLSKIHQPGMIAGDAAIGARIFHGNAVPQQAVKGAVGLGERWRPHPEDLAQGILPRLLGNGRVQALERGAQAARQDDIAERSPLRRCFTGRELRPMPDRIAQFPKPFEGGVFEDGFVEAHGWVSFIVE